MPILASPLVVSVRVGFRVEGLGFRVRVQGSGFWVQGSEFIS